MLLCNTLCNPFSQKSHICMYTFERCNEFLQAYFLFHKLVEKKHFVAIWSLALVHKKGMQVISNDKFKREEVELCGINILKHTLDVKIKRKVDPDNSNKTSFV